MADNSSIMSTLLERIEERLHDLDLAATTAAVEAGLDRTWIVDLRRGRKRGGSNEAILKLADTLKCNPLWLAKGSGDKIGVDAEGEEFWELLELYRSWPPDDRRAIIRIFKGQQGGKAAS